jgi:hypothetical protein
VQPYKFLKTIQIVLLHDGNSNASYPLEHSVQLEENYDHLAMNFEKVCYQKHQRMVNGNFKIFIMLVGK